MPGDLLIADGDVYTSVITGIPCTSAGPQRIEGFESQTMSAYAKKRADLIQHCRRLRIANSKLKALRKEFEEDLAIAARLQRHLEPRPAVWGRVRVDTFSQPARTIGGDFGAVCSLDDQHLNLLVGDVAGHGISAALAANRIFSETRAHLQVGAPLGEMLSRLNHFALQTFNSSSFFFTFAAARLDPSARRMVFAGAGHPPCMVIRRGAEPQLLEARSMMLGALPNAVCYESTIEVDLEPGDRILLYTDGITEVFDERNEMLGIEGLQNFVVESSLLPFEEMLPAILDRTAEWRTGPFADDVTLILAEVFE